MLKTDGIWKTDWERTRQHHLDWWKHDGMVLWVTAPKEKPHADIPEAPDARDMEEFWFGAEHRARRELYRLSRTYFGGDSFPAVSTCAGAGDLAAYLGCPVGLTRETVWYRPCIHEPPERHPPLRFDRNNEVYRKSREVVQRAAEMSQGRYLVIMPDLVENVDILAALRGTETLMTDMVDRPEWVAQRIEEITAAFFDAYGAFHELVCDEHGGSTFCFNLWGLGTTCKVQCDASALFSPAMFRRFVVPALTKQCAWLDNSMYHLDGEDCLPHLDLLLEIEELDAIEWTPRWISQGETGGQRKFHDLYRRILRGRKSVQAVEVEYDHVIPLLDAVGPRGLSISTSAPTEEAARRLEEKVEAYR